MNKPRWELMDEYEERVREAWRALVAVLDNPELGNYEPRHKAFDDALQWLEIEAGCGDCVTGRCHWGGERSRISIAAAKEGHEYIDPTYCRCGCRRHEFSVEIRKRDQSQGAASE